MQHINDQQYPKRLLAIQGGTNNIKRFKPDGKRPFDSRRSRRAARHQSIDIERIKQGLELKDVLLKGDLQGPWVVSDQKQDVWANIAKSVFSGLSIASNNESSKCQTVSKTKQGPPLTKLEDAKATQLIPFSVDYNHAKATKMAPFSIDYNHTSSSNIDDRLSPCFSKFMEQNSEISLIRNETRLNPSFESHDRDRRSFSTYVSLGDHFYDKHIPRNHTVTDSSHVEFREQRMRYVVQSHSETHYRVVNQNLEVEYVPDNSNIWNRDAASDSLLSNAYAKDIDVDDSSDLVKNTGYSLKSFEDFHNKESLSTINSRSKNRKINAAMGEKPKGSAACTSMRSLSKGELNRMGMCR